jgi:hypothetical protein
VSHVLKPLPGNTLAQSYVGKAYANEKGNTECVTFIQDTLGAPPTGQWREGVKVAKGSLNILPGTAIATFVNGHYPNANSGQHAAIYLGQNAEGIQVLTNGARKAW